VCSKNTKPLVHYSKYCKNTAIYQDDLDFFSKLSSQDIVYPMDETTMLHVSKNNHKLSCSLGFPEYPTLEKVINKSRLMRHAIEYDIPCPKTVFIDRSDDISKISNRFEFPAVLKPDIGSGGKGIIFIHSLEAFHAVGFDFFERYGPFMVQEKIPFDHKYTVGVLCNRDSKVRRACVIKEVRNYPVEAGPACFAETVKHQELLDLSVRLMESLNFFGIADIDFLVDIRTGKPKLMEINPRFWGSLQVAINAGVDFPSLLSELMNEGDLKQSFDYRTGIRCRHLLFDDVLNLISILNGHYGWSYKIKSIIDFLSVHPDDGYYIFSLNDLRPFRYHITKKIQSAFRSETLLR
jgi:predicted ATP-grasp superfamily ATP-dependent carboligase